MVLWRYLFVLLGVMPIAAFAQSAHNAEQGYILLGLALIIGGSCLSWIVQKAGLPTVLGELTLGMLIAVLGHYQLGFWPELIANPTIQLLAEIGSILLLFEIGLESNLKELVSIGRHGVITAIIGIILPFTLGTWLVAEYIFGSQDIKLNLFLGATLAATSTGISVRVFKDLGILRNPACQIVLAASIIDDILGLIILAFVSGLVIAGKMDFASVGHILLNVSIFFILALVVARRITPRIIGWILKISNEEAMVVGILIAFCLLWAWFAQTIGLAAIIGAFVAGLILDEVIFRNTKQPFWHTNLLKISNNSESEYTKHVIQEQILAEHQHNRLIELVKPLNYVFVPIFFVYAGMQVDLVQVANWQTLQAGFWLSLVAIAGKAGCGIFLPKTVNRWIVGFGMVPRGEIGLIFALTGRQLGVFNENIFAAVLLMVVVTSVITPFALQLIVKRGLR